MVVLSLGILLAGLVMLRGIFNKPAAYLALAVGVTAFAFMGSYLVGALTPPYVINALLATVWYALAGFRLYRLDQR